MMKVILSGSSNKALAETLSEKTSFPLIKAQFNTFPNQEMKVRILDEVKDKHVYILQSTSMPPNKHIIELALLTNAAKSAGAVKVTAIIPWFGYSPQDKIFRSGEPFSSKVIVQLLEGVDIDDFILVDVHSKSFLDQFTKPATVISALDIFVKHIRNTIPDTSRWKTVAVDKGSIKRATAFAKALDLDLVIFDKTRNLETGNVTFHKLHGDVEGYNILAFDDYISTGGTMIQAVDYLKDLQVDKIVFCVTHIAVPDTLYKIDDSKTDKLITTNSIKFFNPNADKFITLDITDLIAKHITNQFNKSIYDV